MAQTTAASNYAGVWDNRLGFGRKTALIVIDLLQGYTLKGAPLFAPGVNLNSKRKTKFPYCASV